MNSGASEEAILSREELDALLEEMPQLLSVEAEEAVPAWPRSVDLELQRANEMFASEQGQTLSNRHQRVISIHLIGHREIDLPELAEIMLPTDLAAGFRVLPMNLDGFMLMSRPFFFQLLSMNFGAGPTIKPTRPPVREYSRIERRFYARATREMLARVAAAWTTIVPVELSHQGLTSRASIAEAENVPVVLATFDVKGFGESCRIRIAVPAECFTRSGQAPESSRGRIKRGPEVSVKGVPIQLRAEAGSCVKSLSELGSLKVGDLITLDTPSDGSLTIRMGDRAKFKAIAGTQGTKRAIQLIECLEGME